MEKENAARMNISPNSSGPALNKPDGNDPPEIGNGDIFQEKPDINNPSDVNVLREKTFNEDLSDLVSRIRANESIASAEIIKAGISDIENISEDKLLQMFHQLYYKAINLRNMDKINTSFNPFDLYRELSSDYLPDLIFNEMKDISIPEYAILAYSFDNKCYTIYNNRISSLDENNIILSTSEELYSQIMENKNGVGIDAVTIERNLFLRKRFDAKKHLYFLSFSNLFKDFYSEINLEEMNNFPDSLLPVLLIASEEKIDEKSGESIYNKIHERLTVYLFLLTKKILIESRNKQIDDLDDYYKFIDYSYKKYNGFKNCICYIIKCSKYVNIESLLVLKYMQGKLSKKLKEDVSISRIEKDKLLIFSRKSSKRYLDEILDDFNKLYDNLFQVDLFYNSDEIIDNIHLLQNIKEHLVKY